MAARRWAPGIKADGNFRARRRQADADRIDALRKQVIRNELAVAFGVFIAQIKIDDAAIKLGARADQIDHAQVAFIERLKGGGNYGVSHNLGKPTVPHALNDAIHDGAVAARFDDQHQLERRRGKLYGGLGILVLRAVDDVGPFDQLRQIGGLEAVFFGNRIGDELRAGFVSRVIELRRPGAVDEVAFIFRRQESALVMIEPPGQPRRRAVLEIDDGVFVAVEEFFFDELLVRFVGKSAKADFGLRADGFAEKARKHSGGCKAVKAMVVMQYS